MGDEKNQKDSAAPEESLTSRKADKKDQQKIDSLKGIIEEAEKSLYSARAMLSRLEGKGKTGASKKTYGASPDGKIIEGVFDGQLMIGNDGKQYPVPANYASKSKLVEGDMLKLTITDDGNFIYKQIGPVERRRLIGIVREDEAGNYVVEAEGGSYKVLLASVTYYKAQPGDEVTIVIPKDGEPIWGSIENVTKKSFETEEDDKVVDESEEQDPFLKKEKETRSKISKKGKEETVAGDSGLEMSAEDRKTKEEVVEEWAPKLSQIKKEAAEVKESTRELEEESEGEGEEVKIKVNSSKDSGQSGRVVKKDFPDTPEEFFSAKV